LVLPFWLHKKEKKRLQKKIRLDKQQGSLGYGLACAKRCSVCACAGCLLPLPFGVATDQSTHAAARPRPRPRRACIHSAARRTRTMSMMMKRRRDSFLLFRFFTHSCYSYC
jgi:hypothetical protein